MFDRILIAYDGSGGARSALSTAVTLAAAGRAELIVIAVETHLPRYPGTVGEVEEEHALDDWARRGRLAEAEAIAADTGVAVTVKVAVGHAAQEIVRAASEHAADLVVIGHSGHSAMWGRFLGGITERVSRHAPCSVLIVRAEHPSGR